MFMFRSSRPEVFCKEGVLRDFAKFTGKHLRKGLSFNKVADLRPEACNFIIKEALAQVLFCEFFCEFLRTPFFIEYPWWLLLYIRIAMQYPPTLHNVF